MESLKIEAVEDFIPKLYKKLRDDPLLKNIPDLWVHFTSVPHKLGVNPRPSHRDPYGVYMFPKDWVLSGGISKNSMFFSMPYVYIIRVKPNANILNLGTMTRDHAAGLLTVMGIEKYIPVLDEPESRYGGNTIGQKFWQALNHAVEDKFGGFISRGNNGAWNALFKKAGIDGVMDPGESAIHSNEPHQMVVFNVAALDIIEYIDLRSSDYKQRIIYNILKEIIPIFDKGSTRVKTSRYSSSEDSIYLYGSYRGVPYYCYSSFSRWEDTIREFTVTLNVTNVENTSVRKSFELRVGYENQIDYSEIVQQVHDFLASTYDKIESVSKETIKRRGLEIASSLFAFFGIKPKFNSSENNFEATRQYNWGTFSVVLYHDKYTKDKIKWNLILTVYSTGRGKFTKDSNSFGNHMNNSDRGFQSYEDNGQSPEELAKQMVVDAVNKVEENIYKHTNPDIWKYNDNDPRRFEYAMRGRSLLQALYRIKSLPRMRGLFNLEDPDETDETKQTIIHHRNEVDFKGWWKKMQTKYPDIAAIGSGVNYNSRVNTVKPMDHSYGVWVGKGFMNLPEDAREKMLIRAMARSGIENFIFPKFIDSYLPPEAEFPEGTSDPQEALAQLWVDYFTKGRDSVPKEWMPLVRASYAKVKEYVTRYSS